MHAARCPPYPLQPVKRPERVGSSLKGMRRPLWVVCSLFATLEAFLGGGAGGHRGGLRAGWSDVYYEVRRTQWIGEPACLGSTRRSSWGSCTNQWQHGAAGLWLSGPAWTTDCRALQESAVCAVSRSVPCFFHPFVGGLNCFAKAVKVWLVRRSACLKEGAARGPGRGLDAASPSGRGRTTDHRQHREPP
jgi:hypothetical protein